MPKICIMTSAHPAKDSRIFYKQARSLAKAGFEVTLIAQAPLAATAEHMPEKYQASQETAPSSKKHEPIASEICEGVRILYFPKISRRRQRLGNLRQIYHMAYTQKADAYLFHDPDLIPVGLKLQKKLRCPCVYDVHEYYDVTLLHREWVPRPLRRLMAVGFNRYEKWAARRLAGIISVNEHMAKQFARVNPKGVVLFNYALQQQYDFPKPTRERFSEQPRILYVGSVNHVRGLDIILEAMPHVVNKYPEARCLLVGEVDTMGIGKPFLPLDPWLERGHIELTGSVPYARIPEFMQNATLAIIPFLVTPNHLQAIPVKLIEYMASGLPIVASGFGYIEHIITQSTCGKLVEAGNAQDLADAICDLIEDKDQAWHYACRGWEAFRSHYSWESEEPKLISFFKVLTQSDINAEEQHTPLL